MSNGYPHQPFENLAGQVTGSLYDQYVQHSYGAPAREPTAAEVQAMQRRQAERDHAHRLALGALFGSTPKAPEPTPEELAAAKLRAIEAEHRQAHRRFSGEVTAAKPAPKSVLFNGQEVNPVLYDAVTRPEPVTLRAGEVLYSVDYRAEAVPTGEFIEPNPDWSSPTAPLAPANQERETPF